MRDINIIKFLSDIKAQHINTNFIKELEKIYFVYYDAVNENWCMFNIAEELKFNEGMGLEGYLWQGGD